MATATQAAPTPRMSLAAISRGVIEEPHRVVLYGVEGIGKTTFAMSAPGAIALPTEDGTAELDVPRFPKAESVQDLHDAIDALRAGGHEYRSLVIDTLDFAEPLIWSHICQRDKEKSIESYGYGKGYTAALDEWRRLLAGLEALQRETRMNLILVAHSWIKTFKNPQGTDFDRYQLKLNEKAAGLIKEWAKTVLFANYETFAVEDSKTKRAKGVSTGARLIYTQRTAAYDAKNRSNLPESLPLSWDDFAAAVVANRPADPALLAAEIERKANELGGEVGAKALIALNQNRGNAAFLARANDRLNALLAEKSAQGVN